MIWELETVEDAATSLPPRILQPSLRSPVVRIPEQRLSMHVQKLTGYFGCS